MDVYFSTVVRQGPIAQGGELVHIDWSTKKVHAKSTLSPTDPIITEKDDANPRGNSRGGRGIVKMNDTIYVATYHSLLLFDQMLNPKGKISNNLFVGLHEIFLNDDVIWLTSTAIDCVIGIDTQGNCIDSWWAREDTNLQKHFSLTPLKIDKTIDNRMLWLKVLPARQPDHTHLNAVAIHKEQLYVLLNRFGAVYNTTTNRLVLEDTSIIGCHNLVFFEDKILINDTKGKRVMVYTQNGKLVQSLNLLDFPEINAIYQAASKSPKAKSSSLFRGFSLFSRFMNREHEIKSPLFLRGLSPIGQSRILVGFSPATIAEIDIEKGKLLDLFSYSQDIAVCVHGLLACS
ncbi:MAG: hypothetical protein E3K37_07245 [Candidatus Kuenenia sp.]|nr:hypothetical protein [Candidatus Kuenenia hertensis]